MNGTRVGRAALRLMAQERPLKVAWTFRGFPLNRCCDSRLSERGEPRMIRHRLTNEQWNRIAELIPGKPGDPGRTGDDNRRRRKGGTYPLSHLYGHFGLVRLSALGRDVSWVKA